MYIGTSKPHTAQVAEHTFLLCKPDAQQYHRHILQTVSDAGFLVLAKRFLITPALAEDIAGTFPSVRRRMYTERGVDKLFKSGGASDQLSPPRRAARDPPLDGCADFDGSAGGGGGDATIVKRHRDQAEAHQGITADILRLTRRHGEADDGVNAGLPGADGDEGAETRDQKADRRVATAAVLKNTLLESMSYQDLLHEHVQHLAFGGTCLALELSRQNAVERLLEMVGPENPIDARRAAPTSIRARLGTDLIRNAVHAASNLAEASHCISAVFGFTTHYSAADIRTNTAVSESTGAKGDERSAGMPRAVRPSSELVTVPLRGAHRVPLTPASFRLANVNAQAHVSYYTDRPASSADAADKSNMIHHSPGEAGGEHAARDALSWQRRAEYLERELTAERLALVTHAKLLRSRELDLLLREHALEDATHGFLAAPQPVSRGCPSLSGVADTGSSGYLPLLSGLFTSRSASASFRSTTGGPLSTTAAIAALTGGVETAGGLHSSGPAVVAAEDVAALLAKPVRLRALFFAVQQGAAGGEVTHEDILALYDRSPAVQLMWLDNHRECFQKYLSERVEEPVSFDSFVAVLMFLFKQ